ncbi:hypothetical protein PVK06_004345 [Gossypium arboreum]|uniref:SCP domain-containing protein n=1 Tax=Gossypium arboreum TaxID=29729 RepID=A0ABR0QRQ7_GOSAR|nr:hypothetical protein PVK06_004345 [Gossypium arboreum]
MMASATYRRCPNGTEMKEHVFRECPIANETWEKLGFNWPTFGESTGFKDWLKYFITNYIKELDGLSMRLPVNGFRRVDGSCRLTRRLESTLMLFLIRRRMSHARAQISLQDFVNAHNVTRAKAGVDPLVWNQTLASYAQNYANKRIGDCKMEPSYGPYAENPAEGHSNLDGVDAVKMWASEKPDYDHNSSRR